jgi:foldase protein PrsA
MPQAPQKQLRARTEEEPEMKKTLSILAAVIALSSLTGCTDAVAKLKDKNSVLMTVGKTSITKGQVYTMMSTASGAYTAVTDASETVAAAEVEVTDDMKTQAESTLNYYKNAYGDSFATTLAQNNMTEDDLYNNLILSSQIDALTKQYVTENFDDLVSQYTPIKAYVLDFASQDNANAALADLKNGKEPTAVVTEYSASTSTGVTRDLHHQFHAGLGSPRRHHQRSAGRRLVHGTGHRRQVLCCGSR